MLTDPSTSEWTHIDPAILRSIQTTTDARELSRTNWPHFAAESTKFNRIVVLSFPADSTLCSTSRSTGILATLLTERIDPKDAPNIYNYNRHLIAETTDGQAYLSPPMKTTDPLHHSSSPSTWFDGLGSPV